MKALVCICTVVYIFLKSLDGTTVSIVRSEHAVYSIRYLTKEIAMRDSPADHQRQYG